MVHTAMLVLAAATPTEGGGPQGGSLLFYIPAYAAIFALFYFLMIRPARQRQREHGAMLSALKPGDKVVCASGIHATVVGVDDATVQVRIADQVRIEVDKSSITSVKRSGD